MAIDVNERKLMDLLACDDSSVDQLIPTLHAHAGMAGTPYICFPVFCVNGGVNFSIDVSAGTQASRRGFDECSPASLTHASSIFVDAENATANGRNGIAAQERKEGQPLHEVQEGLHARGPGSQEMPLRRALLHKLL
jgi:hypothetical protein